MYIHICVYIYKYMDFKTNNDIHNRDYGTNYITVLLIDYTIQGFVIIIPITIQSRDTTSNDNDNKVYNCNTNYNT